ncbi:YccS family putative transporter [Rhodoferax sp. U11-2br]|uniref:YccS family putative transporter n=1 Tax=Rhodoferax sp. U11-2br TaxID=2838878 RepID=UPI001BEB5B4A|nr:YccS family putative transporter [Rhodoferax sp. U11-2br]MBT3066671.1 TIGR01666 family membrane protein [Rhodoferax sp. U11-2br]
MFHDLVYLRRLWSHDKTLDSLKVALAFAGVVGFCFVAGHEDWLIGLILGIIAAALAESPDRVAGRMKALLVTLLCFGVTSVSVRLLFPYPWLFAVGLALSTFTYVMLGALGERYATIAIASVILAIYTMLGVAQHADNTVPFLHDPLLLLAGTCWYGAISLVAAAIFANRPASQVVSQVFVALGRYLALKASLLEPVRGRDVKALRLALAAQNGRLVGQMNRARQILLLWAQSPRPAHGARPFLQWYFLAQEVHERASSAHHPYEALSEAFSRSDVLFRCQRLMSLQAAACTRLGQAIAQGDVFDYGNAGALALQELDAALSHVQTTGPQDKALVNALSDLCRNLRTIELRLSHAGQPDALEVISDSTLRDADPQTLAEMWRRLRQQFRPSSRRFRHGLRLSAALTAGYALLNLLDLPQGYWVLLTTVFVCQPNFSSTWLRLGQRVGGTVAGLLAATLFVSSFPHPLAQLALVVASGVAFFNFRAERYSLATACITVLVMVCFNQFGSSYALVWPRLLDTLLGSLLAIAAVAFILPEWHGKRVHHAMARSLSLSATYLSEILSQYRSGPRDDLPYRVARRDAHNADAELSSTLASMLTEPDRYSLPPDAAYRFLCASHTLLGYVSALGAHREQDAAGLQAAEITLRETCIQHGLEQIASALTTRSAVILPGPVSTAPAQALEHGVSETAQRVMRQLSLIEGLLPELAELASGFAVDTQTGQA